MGEEVGEQGFMTISVSHRGQKIDTHSYAHRDEHLHKSRKVVSVDVGAERQIPILHLPEPEEFPVRGSKLEYACESDTDACDKNARGHEIYGILVPHNVEGEHIDADIGEKSYDFKNRRMGVKGKGIPRKLPPIKGNVLVHPGGLGCDGFKKTRGERNDLQNGNKKK